MTTVNPWTDLFLFFQKAPFRQHIKWVKTGTYDAFRIHFQYTALTTCIYDVLLFELKLKNLTIFVVVCVCVCCECEHSELMRCVVSFVSDVYMCIRSCHSVPAFVQQFVFKMQIEKQHTTQSTLAVTNQFSITTIQSFLQAIEFCCVAVGASVAACVSHHMFMLLLLLTNVLVLLAIVCASSIFHRIDYHFCNVCQLMLLLEREAKFKTENTWHNNGAFDNSTTKCVQPLFYCFQRFHVMRFCMASKLLLRNVCDDICAHTQNSLHETRIVVWVRMYVKYKVSAGGSYRNKRTYF